MEKENGAVLREIENLLAGFDGGKYPPLWEIGLLIDDSAEELNKVAGRLGIYGFLAIDPLRTPEEGEEAWVDRVLDQVDQWQASIKR